MMCCHECDNNIICLFLFYENKKRHHENDELVKNTTGGRLLCLLPAVERIYRRYIASQDAMSVLKANVLETN